MSSKLKRKEGFIKVTGGKVWYKRVGRGKGLPLIVLHGGPGSGHGYMTPLKDLSGEREVIFYDQLGCGKSDEPDDKSLWTVERFVEELYQVINSLGLKSYHILGQSWGSALALHFAISKPKGIKSIIFADPYIDSKLWERDAKDLIKKLPRDIQKILNKPTTPTFVKSPEFKRASKEFYKKFVYGFDRKPTGYNKVRSRHSNVVYEYMWGVKEFSVTGTLKNHNISNKLSVLNLPVLFVCGRIDEATPKTVKYYKDLTKNAKIEIFENSAHLPHWTDRNKYMKTVSKFLNSVDSNI